MKHKKTFWRGFGSGVLFAAVILGISCLIRTSDAQVVARAKKLGMVYETSDSNALALKSKDQEQKATNISLPPNMWTIWLVLVCRNMHGLSKMAVGVW